VRFYRLGTNLHPVWDSSGAALYGGRWNPPGVPVIDTAGTLSLAMLERLVQRHNLRGTILVEADVPDDIEMDDLMTNPPENWRALGSPEAQAAGAAWVVAGRTPVLRVPSALVPREPNYVINPAHPDAAVIHPHRPEPLEWDPRFFGIPHPRGSRNRIFRPG
jgi:RES domain-containing protein